MAMVGTEAGTAAMAGIEDIIIGPALGFILRPYIRIRLIILHITVTPTRTMEAMSS